MTASHKRVGIRDVANAAGVSITAVSWTLNGKGEVAESTRRRIREVAESLGYQPNEAARSLQSGRSRILGVAIAHRNSRSWEQTYLPYYRSVVAGAAMEAVEHGHAVAAIPFEADGRMRFTMPIDGMVVVDPVRDDPILAECRRRGITVVTDGRPIDEVHDDEPMVQSDTARGLAELFGRLDDLQVRSPALLIGPEADSYTLDSTRYFRNWCRRAGHSTRVVRLKPGQDPVEAAGDLLDETERPGAIHSLNETYGNAVLEAAGRRRLRVPQDLAVTMMGDATSVAPGNGAVYLVLDPVAVGAAATRLLVGALDHESVEDLLLPCRVVDSPQWA
ncbi:LacI family DNA-binding transcriptional regulator [Leekyejoonella antrihumi]|uniref:LacI family DNA-binding transcriptional regulator n=1 Tax=Leekyejoonella antrihumi TaxID=1660198 RepID=UPI0016456C92|nr:LacI family DNA-binding transcriptional regulator [Leekyejoonella antrihumi]